MKAVHIHFEDKEYNALVKAKGEKTWRQVVLDSLGD